MTGQRQESTVTGSQQQSRTRRNAPVRHLFSAVGTVFRTSTPVPALNVVQYPEATYELPASPSRVFPTACGVFAQERHTGCTPPPPPLVSVTVPAPIRKKQMDYCSTCHRHLNGALVCPGCGAYAPDIAPGVLGGHHVPGAATAHRNVPATAGDPASWADRPVPPDAPPFGEPRRPGRSGPSGTRRGTGGARPAR